jgi:hypothetical protein
MASSSEDLREKYSDLKKTVKYTGRRVIQYN